MFHKVIHWNEVVDLEYRFSKGNQKAICFFGRRRKIVLHERTKVLFSGPRPELTAQGLNLRSKILISGPRPEITAQGLI